LLITLGFHVPVIPLVEVVGNIGLIEPSQKGIIALNVGAISAFTVMIFITVFAH
jgi:hypothetical protein